MESDPSGPLAGRRLGVWLAGIAGLALLLHAGNLLYLARAQGCRSPLLVCPTHVGPWGAGDYHTYRSVAVRIRDRGFFETSYLKRTPGYPLVLLSALTATGETSPARWLGPPAAALAAASIGWLAFHVTGSTAAAVLAGLLFCLWPSAFQLSSALRPDGPHAFLAVTALATTVGWRVTRHLPLAGLSAGLWLAVQSLRPTFFPLPLLLPILLWLPRASPSYRRASAALWLATVLVPAFVVGSNWRTHGIATPSHVLTVNLACYSVPRLKEELGLGSFHELRRECWSRYRRRPPQEKVPAQLEEASSFFRAHPLPALRSFAHEIGAQMLHPIRPWASRQQEALYPRWAAIGSAGVGAFWLLGIAGLYAVTLRDPRLAIFLLLSAAAVMLPAATSHLVGGRLRFPLELFMLPVAVAGAASIARLVGTLRRRGPLSASGP